MSLPRLMAAHSPTTRILRQILFESARAKPRRNINILDALRAVRYLPTQSPQAQPQPGAPGPIKTMAARRMGRASQQSSTRECRARVRYNSLAHLKPTWLSFGVP